MTNQHDPIPILTLEEWRQQAVKIFGTDDPKLWKFKCPVCNHVQCAKDMLLRYPDQEEYIKNSFYMSCEGRLNPKAMAAFKGRKPDPAIGCDYTCGGLFQLNNIFVISEEDGAHVPVFDFAKTE